MRENLKNDWRHAPPPPRDITLSTQDAEERAESSADSLRDFASKDRSAVVRAVVSVAGGDSEQRSPAVRRGTVTDISNE